MIKRLIFFALVFGPVVCADSWIVDGRPGTNLIAGSSNPFDQNLNQSNSPTFASVSARSLKAGEFGDEHVFLDGFGFRYGAWGASNVYLIEAEEAMIKTKFGDNVISFGRTNELLLLGAWRVNHDATEEAHIVNFRTATNLIAQAGRWLPEQGGVATNLLVYQQANEALVFDSGNMLLNDDAGNPSVQWNSRWLIDGENVTTLDWQSRHLYGEWTAGGDVRIGGDVAPETPSMVKVLGPQGSTGLALSDADTQAVVAVMAGDHVVASFRTDFGSEITPYVDFHSSYLLLEHNASNDNQVVNYRTVVSLIADAGAANPFDQYLDTGDSPTFAGLTIGSGNFEDGFQATLTGFRINDLASGNIVDLAYHGLYDRFTDELALRWTVGAGGRNLLGRWSVLHDATNDQEIVNFRVATNLIARSLRGGRTNVAGTVKAVATGLPVDPVITLSFGESIGELAQLELLSFTSTNFTYQIRTSGGVATNAWAVNWTAVPRNP